MLTNQNVAFPKMPDYHQYIIYIKTNISLNASESCITPKLYYKYVIFKYYQCTYISNVATIVLIPK